MQLCGECISYLAKPLPEPKTITCCLNYTDEASNTRSFYLTLEKRIRHEKNCISPLAG